MAHTHTKEHYTKQFCMTLIFVIVDKDHGCVHVVIYQKCIEASRQVTNPHHIHNSNRVFILQRLLFPFVISPSIII